MGLLSLGAWWMERKRRELLWFAAFASAHGWGTYYFGVMLDASTRPFNDLGTPAAQIALTQLTAPFLGEFALAAFGVRAVGWWRLLFWGSYVGLVGGLVFGPGGNWPIYYGATLSVCTLFGLAAVAVAEHFIRLTARVPNWIPFSFYIGRYQVFREDLLALLVAAAMLTILLRRILADRQEEERPVGELEAAGVIQRLLLRETALAEPGLTLDAVYAPAQEVGGDLWAGGGGRGRFGQRAEGGDGGIAGGGRATGDARAGAGGGAAGVEPGVGGTDGGWVRHLLLRPVRRRGESDRGVRRADGALRGWR